MHDLRINEDGSLPLTFGFITGADLILQRVAIRLRTFLGEWQLDTAVGLPYLEWVQQKPPDVDGIGAVIRAQVLGVPGVIRFDSFTGTFDVETRSLRYDGSIIIDNELEATLTVLPFGPEGNASTAVVSLAVSPIVDVPRGIVDPGVY